MFVTSLRTLSAVTILVLGSGLAVAQEQDRPQRNRSDRAENRAENSERGDRGERRRPLAGPDAQAPRQREGQGMTGRQMGGRGNPIVTMIQELDLSEEQKDKVRSIVAEHQGATRVWREENGEQMQELRKQMAEARKAENKEASAQLQKQMRELMASSPQQDAMVKKLREVLTKEQLTTLDEKLEARRKEAAERRSRERDAKGERRRPGKDGDAEGERPQRKRPARELDL